jgi:hypothetical protein
MDIDKYELSLKKLKKNKKSSNNVNNKDGTN